MDPRPTARERIWWARSRARCKRYGVRYKPGIRIDDVVARTSGQCWICRKSVGSRFHIDHIFPLALGGSHDLYNLAVTHPTCNLRKGIDVMLIPAPEAHALMVSVLASKRLKHLPATRRVVCDLGPFSIGPITVVSRLKLPPGRVAAAIRETIEIQAAIRDSRARIYLDNEFLAIETANPYPIEPDTSTLRPKGLRFPIGFDSAFGQVSVDFEANAHAAVFGVTGAGKSVALETLAWSAAKAGHRLILVDSVCNTWKNLEDLAALSLGVPRTRAEVTPTLELAVRRMFEVNPRDVREHVFVFVDEVAGPPKQNLAGLDARGMAALALLLTNGRKYGYHVIMADQQPQSTRIPTDMLNQCTIKLALLCGSAVASNTILGETGAELLLGRGDALLKQKSLVAGDKSAIVRLQVAKMPERWAEIPRGPRRPTVAAAPVTPRQERANDDPIVELALAENVKNPSDVMRLTRRLGLGVGGKGVGRPRAERIFDRVTALLAGNREGVPSW